MNPHVFAVALVAVSLLLLGSTVAVWVTACPTCGNGLAETQNLEESQNDTRFVVTQTGVERSGELLLVSLATLIIAGLGARWPRFGGFTAVILGVVGTVIWARGFPREFATPWAYLAGGSTLGMLLLGVSVLFNTRRPRNADQWTSPSKYTVEGVEHRSGDEEWNLASEEESNESDVL